MTALPSALEGVGCRSRRTLRHTGLSSPGPTAVLSRGAPSPGSKSILQVPQACSPPAPQDPRPHGPALAAPPPAPQQGDLVCLLDPTEQPLPTRGWTDVSLLLKPPCVSEVAVPQGQEGGAPETPGQRPAACVGGRRPPDRGQSSQPQRPWKPQVGHVGGCRQGPREPGLRVAQGEGTAQNGAHSLERCLFRTQPEDSGGRRR